jgi:2-C-methyl-D-erythritol 4-phosphate cytidylyltransferase
VAADSVRYGLVIPAAGSGARFGGDVPKQHQPLAGGSVLDAALAPFLADPRCTAIAVVLAGDDPQWPVLRSRLSAKVRFAPGGPARSDSVLSGLAVLADSLESHDWVLVHDAARPCLSAADLERLLDAGVQSPAGALLAVPMADTIKEADTSARVLQTVPRHALWRALTPQMFRLADLRNALDAAIAAGREPTDESQAMEWQGRQPLLVGAADENLKITTAGDLSLAAAILASRSATARNNSR